jgi:recombination protein U
MGYFHTRGLRGSTFEELINLTNEAYLRHRLAAIQKISTPITPVEFDKGKGVITLAYFGKESTVDYIGNVQGVPICFDAKETSLKSLPIQNIHEHQLRFMEAYAEGGAAAFILVHFTFCDEYYLVDFETIKSYCDGAGQGGRKSIPYSAMKKQYEIFREGEFLVHYLKALGCYLEELGI